MADSKRTGKSTKLIVPQKSCEAKTIKDKYDNDRKIVEVRAPYQENNVTYFAKTTVFANQVKDNGDGRNTVTFKDADIKVNIDRGAKEEGGKHEYENVMMSPRKFVSGVLTAKESYKEEQAEQRKDKKSVYLDNISEDCIHERDGRNGKPFMSVSIPIRLDNGIDTFGSIAVPPDFVRDATKGVKDEQGNYTGERENIPGRKSVYIGKEGGTRKINIAQVDAEGNRIGYEDVQMKVEDIRDKSDISRQAYKDAMTNAQKNAPEVEDNVQMESTQFEMDDFA